MLQLVVKLAPHIKHHILADGVEQQRLKIREHQPQNLNAGVEHQQELQTSVLTGQDVPVDRILE